MRLFFLVLVTCLLFHLWLPWWIVMVVPFILCFWIGSKSGHVFLTSFLAVFLLWLSACLIIHIRSGGLLSERVSALLHTGNPLLLVLITALIGGFAAGFAGWAGHECRHLLRQIKRRKTVN